MKRQIKLFLFLKRTLLDQPEKREPGRISQRFNFFFTFILLTLQHGSAEMPHYILLAKSSLA